MWYHTRAFIILAKCVQPRDHSLMHLNPQPRNHVMHVTPKWVAHSGAMGLYWVIANTDRRNGNRIPHNPLGGGCIPIT